MKKYLLTASLLLIVSIFTGCGPKAISVPKESINVDDYEKMIINKNNNIDLIIYANRAGVKPVQIRIDNKIVQKMSPYTYSYHEIEKGFHWIAVNGTENHDFLCKDFSKGKYFIKIDAGMGLFDARFKIIEKIKIDDIDEEIKQIVQQDKYVKRYSDLKDLEKVTVTSESKNEKMISLISSLKNNLEKLGSSDSEKDNLVIKISLIDFKDGNMFGRYFFGGLEESKKYADSLSIKVQTYSKGTLVDTFFSSKIINSGVFGGATSGMIDDLSTEITSYISCKFYETQYPVK